MSTKRVIELAQKLQHKENEHLIERLHDWVKQSAGYADMMMTRYGPNEAQKDANGYRLLYILNHYCPSLHHFHRAPDPMRFKGDIDGYNRAMEKHWCENTQAGLQDQDGTLLQEGVVYDTENLNAFLDAVRPYCDAYYRRLWHELGDAPFDDHNDCDMTLAETWHGFPVGTEREDIWHWFDERYSGGVYALLYGVEAVDA